MTTNKSYTADADYTAAKAKMMAEKDARPTTMERTERAILRRASDNTYSPDDFPGSRRYMLHLAASRALAAFDAAHPDLVAALAGERKAQMDALYAAQSDFVKRGS